MKNLLCLILLLTGPVTYGQMAGSDSFSFLNVPAFARSAALGGVNASLADRDVNFLFNNPALLGDTLGGFAAANYQFYLADVGVAAFTYAHEFNGIGTLGLGVQHMNYGTIKRFDATGQEMGDYSSGETAVVLSKSHTINNFRLGVSFKAAFSNIAGYRATAIMADAGGIFLHPEKDFTVGIVLKNAGLILSEYSATSNSSLPFDVQVGTTFKPEHMPLRFSITAYNLTRIKDNDFYRNDNEEQGTVEKILRHFNFGAELLLHKHVNVLVGYNYLVHRELKLENAGGSAGISFGFSARIKSVEFVFSRSGYVIGNAGYAFTLSTNIDSMLTRR